MRLVLELGLQPGSYPIFLLTPFLSPSCSRSTDMLPRKNSLEKVVIANTKKGKQALPSEP